MKISLNWLKEFVDVPAGPRELKQDLTALGFNVEAVTEALEDWLLEVEVTTNRPDCLSHLGVAREVAALYRRPLKLPETALKESGGEAAGSISIEIADPDLCGRYCGRVIRNVQVKPSPAWLARRLEAVGQRPINNVADITNYVLMELGHPLHAFDLAKLRGGKIVVRRARPGEPLRTLDGVLRTLNADDLVIADAERAVALAGVMGGEDSEICPSTREVLLESAWFDPASIRRTAKRHGMRSEASYRFERGADVEMAPVAIDRVARLVGELAGGEVLRGMVDVYPRRAPREELILRRSEIARMLGTEIPGEDVERILRSLGFQARPGKTEGWLVRPPTFRVDVTREVDLIEEIARHFGYDRLPARVRPAPPRVEKDATREKELTMAARLVALGYREIIPPSMVDPEENQRFTSQPPVLLKNPLSQEASALRSSAVPSMLRALRWNLDRDQADLRLYEIGRTYGARSGSLPDERRVLTLGLSGHARPASVHDHARPFGFFDLKGDLESLLEVFTIQGVRFEPSGGNYYEPGQCARFVVDRKTLALFGRLGGEVARDYKLRQPVWVAEVDLEELFELPLRAPAFQPFSKFPAVERDFSLLIPEGVAYRRLEEAIKELGIEELRSIRPIERLPEGQIARGFYSLLLRVVFQSLTRTLTSDEIAAVSDRLVGTLATLNIKLRS